MRFFPSIVCLKRIGTNTLLNNHVVGIALIVWTVILLFFQYVDPTLTIAHCTFPDIPDPETGISKPSANKILLIADPQLIDNHTYPDRWGPFLALSKFTVDNYIYKNYVKLIDILEPDTILFLGDLLDNGRESDDAYYEQEFNRFQKIFVDPIKDRNIDMITSVPGNHDIGWENGVTRHSLERFKDHFGSPNKVVQVANHDLVFLDDLSITNTKDLEVANPSRHFVDTIGETQPERTRILFQHVPLWRDAHTQQCGRSRESKRPFPISKGYQYQTVLDEALSLNILKNVQPDIIFSGDDHDYCEVVHSYTDNQGTERKVRGINVKSISMAMGIHRPAVELLTLYSQPVQLEKDLLLNNNLVKSKGELLDYQYDICYTTKPYIDILCYIFLAVFNGLWLIFNSVEKKKRYVGIATIHTAPRRPKIEDLLRQICWLRLLKLSLLNAICVSFLFFIIFHV